MIARAALLSLVASMAAAQTLNIPTRSGDIISLPKASVITGDEDFGNKEFDRGTPCDSDEDTGSENAVFILQDGASISNVIIGADSLEGVHCMGSCTLTNVWFRDVCEDAISVLGTGDALIVGGGAREAIDKVVQHNGPGTVTIRNYTIVNAGKLYRSCGDCTNNSKKSPRHVIVENVRAFGLKSDLIGINPNFGDTASITGSCGSTKQVCSEYTGVDKGNGKSQRLGTTEKCSGDQGKLEKLPECDASGDEPSTPVEPTSTQAATTSSPTTLVTKTSAQQTPVEPTPVEPTSAEPTPVEPTLAEPSPVEPSPVEPSPVETTPAEPTPTECDESKTVPLWGRCGGKGYTGPTTCASGKCVQFNPWYSQCV